MAIRVNERHWDRIKFPVLEYAAERLLLGDINCAGLMISPAKPQGVERFGHFGFRQSLIHQLTIEKATNVGISSCSRRSFLKCLSTSFSSNAHQRIPATFSNK